MPVSVEKSIEKQQKSLFWLHFFFLSKSSLQNQKPTFTVKFSPSPSLVVIFLLLFIAGAELQPLILVHILTLPQFSISQLHCMLRNNQNFWQCRVFPYIFYIYTKFTTTPTYHRNFLLVVFFSGGKFQNIPW